MYVCICNRVTDSQLRKAVENGAHTVKSLQSALNLGTNCGSCLLEAKAMLDGHLSDLVRQNPDLYYAA